MPHKVIVDEVENLLNSSGRVTLNENTDKLANEFDKVLYADGSTPLKGTVDADSNRIINLPDAVTPSEPVTLRQSGAFADAVAALNNYYPTKEAGELATAVGQFFTYPDGAGQIVYAERLVIGSQIIGEVATQAGIDRIKNDLASPGGAEMVAGPNGTVRDYLNTFPVEAFGAVGDGTTDDGPAIALAIAAASVAGGVVQFDGSRTYRNDTRHWIEASDVVIDGQGCTLTGSGRINFDGDTGVDGDWSGALENVAMRNIHFTGGHFGPIVKWCKNFHLDRLSRDNAAGSFINIYICRGGRVSNCTASNGAINQIFILGFHADNVVYENCGITGGSWVYGIQIKGGANNVVRDCYARDCVCEEMFRDRGDAPWKPSATDTELDPHTGLGYTYPYTDLSWDVADPRRASTNTSWENCWAYNVTFPTGTCKHYVSQEATGSKFANCHSDLVGNSGAAIGFFLFMSTVGATITVDEKNHRLVGCTAKGSSTAAAPQNGFRCQGESVANPLRGIYLEDCEASGFTQDAAFEMIQLASPNFFACRADNNTGQSGFLFTDCSAVTLDECSGSGNVNGILFQTVSLTTTVIPKIIRPNFTANTTNINCWLPMVLENPVEGAPSVQTVDGSNNNSTQRFKLSGGKMYRIEVHVGYEIAGGASGGTFSRMVVARDNAGAAALVGPMQTLFTDLNPDTLTGVTLTASGDSVRVNLIGKAATTVNWRINRIVCEALN